MMEREEKATNSLQLCVCACLCVRCQGKAQISMAHTHTSSHHHSTLCTCMWGREEAMIHLPIHQTPPYKASYSHLYTNCLVEQEVLDYLWLASYSP